jgi:hypothetical protein
MHEIKCKRIIDGRTYNTETATQVAGWTDTEEIFCSQGDYLYQTRHGAFFRYTFLSGLDEQDHDTIKPLTPDEARAWLEKNKSWDTDLIEKLFGEMPEAGSGEVKFTLRMPESLRTRLAEKAEAKKQSLNAWIVRCLESCAGEGDNA